MPVLQAGPSVSFYNRYASAQTFALAPNATDKR